MEIPAPPVSTPGKQTRSDPDQDDSTKSGFIVDGDADATAPKPNEGAGERRLS